MKENGGEVGKEEKQSMDSQASHIFPRKHSYAQLLRMYVEKPDGNTVSEEPGGQAQPASISWSFPCCSALGTIHPVRWDPPSLWGCEAMSN